MASATARIVLTPYFVVSLYFRLPVPQMCPFYQQKFLEDPKLRDLKSIEGGITKFMDYLEVPPISPVL